MNNFTKNSGRFSGDCDNKKASDQKEIKASSKKKVIPNPIKKTVEDEKKLINNLTEKKIDKTIDDSFPASDPPSTY